MPGACALDSTGNLFIADTANHRIAKVDTKGIITTVAGTGTAGASADGTTATAAALSSPAGVAVDDGGDIFISDTGNNLIRQVTPDGAIHTIAGNATAAFSGDGGPAVSASINAPAGIVMDGSGALYFADSGNNRVRILTRQATPPPTTTPVTIPQVTAVNGASLLPGSVAPGEIITIYGSSIGPAQGVAGTLNASGLLSNLIAGTEVRFDGVAAPLYYAQAGQVNVQAPYTISGQSTTHVEVIYQGQTAGQADLNVMPTAPAMFPTVLNQDNSLNGMNAPALQGTILTFFATGEGMTTGSNIAGQPAGAPYPQPSANVSLTVGGSAATLTYAGEAPGLVGLLQIDAVLPAGLPSGASNAILTVGGVSAPATAIWVQ
ncbi:MAG TPA: hypothetical protein VHW69_04965, partial [Rhizomicrobium sp.]|nr:hypothetical protein [Rhizomicrobium sp.]